MNPHENTIMTNWDPATEINGVLTTKILSGQLNAQKQSNVPDMLKGSGIALTSHLIRVLSDNLGDIM